MNFVCDTTAALPKPGRRRVRRTHYSSSRSYGKYIPSPVDFIASYYAVRNRWASETAFSSDPQDIFGHQSYKALVENARVALPLIVADLRACPSNLVFVLEDAFNVTPYAPSDAGDLKAMTNAWLAWAAGYASLR